MKQVFSIMISGVLFVAVVLFIVKNGGGATNKNDCGSIIARKDSAISSLRVKVMKLQEKYKFLDYSCGDNTCNKKECNK